MAGGGSDIGELNSSQKSYSFGHVWHYDIQIETKQTKANKKETTIQTDFLKVG